MLFPSFLFPWWCVLGLGFKGVPRAAAAGVCGWGEMPSMVDHCISLVVCARVKGVAGAARSGCWCMGEGTRRSWWTRLNVFFSTRV